MIGMIGDIPRIIEESPRVFAILGYPDWGVTVVGSRQHGAAVEATSTVQHGGWFTALYTETNSADLSPFGSLPYRYVQYNDNVMHRDDSYYHCMTLYDDNTR